MDTHSPLTTPLTPDEPRVRELPAWKATLLCISAALLALAIMVLPGAIAPTVTTGATAETIVAGVFGVGFTVVGFPTLALLFGIPPRAMFLRWPTADSLRWVGVALSLAVLLVAIGVGSGMVSIDTGNLDLNQVVGSLVAGAAIGLWTATLEESLIRGILCSIIGHRWHWPGAIATTAILFGLLHHAAATTLTGTILYIALTSVAGVLFGIITVTSGSIGNAVLFHAAWNSMFNEFVVSLESGTGDSILALATDGHVLVAAGGSSLTESPLALALFVLALLGTWWRCCRTTQPLSKQP